MREEALARRIEGAKPSKQSVNRCARTGDSERLIAYRNCAVRRRYIPIPAYASANSGARLAARPVDVTDRMATTAAVLDGRTVLPTRSTGRNPEAMGAR